MSLLTLSDLTLRIAGRTLLDAASLTVDPGHKIGLIGHNGAGKSTLLAAIAGDIPQDGGTITLANRATMGRVKQETPSGNTSLIETVLAGDSERTLLLDEAETATDPTRIADIHERLIAIDAYTAPARAGTILSGLGFDQDAQQRPVSDFSGGWRMRVGLATALFLSPDLLLLDEPTNHLDIEAVLWLESWLAKFPGAAIIVSHDRSLLDNTVEAIAHLDRGKLSLTPGGYDDFVRIRTEHKLQQNRMAERVATQRAHMQSFVDRFRAKATKARQAQARLKALEKLPQIDAVIEDTPTRFHFPEPTPLPPPMLSLENVTAGYNNHIVLKNLNQRLDMEDRIALLGQNGRGKSTFAKILAGRLPPLSGAVRHSSKLRIGYFAQHQSDELVLTDTPIAHMARAMPEASPVAVRAQLDRFGLDAMRAETRVAELSGGEKARLLLALATREAPHLLLLDEPTNHLDLDARDALIRALMAFDGAVVLISHDSHLVEAVADRFWLVENGTITPFDGDMAEYKAWLLERARRARAENAERARTTPSHREAQPAGERRNEHRSRGGVSSDLPPSSTQPSSSAQRRADRKEQVRALAPLRRQVRDAETQLAQIGQELAAVEGKLADPALYQSGNPGEIAALNAHRAALAARQSQVEDLWLKAQSTLENASS